MRVVYASLIDLRRDDMPTEVASARSKTRSPDGIEDAQLRRSHKEHRRRKEDEAGESNVLSRSERPHKDRGSRSRELSESTPVLSPHKSDGDDWRAALSQATEKTKKKLAKSQSIEEDERSQAHVAQEKEIEVLLAKALAERQQGVAGTCSEYLLEDIY